MFKVGDKVRCVDPHHRIKRGEIYRVMEESYIRDGTHFVMVYVGDGQRTDGGGTFYASRFELAESASMVAAAEEYDEIISLKDRFGL